MKTILDLHNIYYSYHTSHGETRALSNLSFSLAPGEFAAVVGPSGCGKSTLLSLICGLMKPQTGEILLNGEPVLGNSPQIGYMLQHDHLFEWRTIYRNILLGPEISHTLNKEIREKAKSMLTQYGLKSFIHARPSQLSGGMRQRAALIRTLLPEPELLLLDEPFAAIDAKVRQELRSWLREMITRVGITSIFVTHDQDEAIEVADEIIITNHGHIEQAGTPIEIYSQPKTPFVTEFMGSPTRISNITSFHGYEELGEGLHAVVRPEHVSVTKKTEQSRFSSSVEEGVVERVMFRGREVELHVRVHDVLLVANRRLEEASITEGERVNVFIYQVFAFPAGENGTQNVNIVENANIETEKLFYI